MFDLSKAGVEATAAAIEADGSRVLPLHGDVTADDQVEQVVATAVTTLGPLTTAVACAGIAVTGTALDVSVTDWQRTLNVNLTGVFLTARHTIPRMIESGGKVFTAMTRASRAPRASPPTARPSTVSWG